MFKTHAVVLALLFLWAPATIAEERNTNDVNHVILEELRGIRGSLDRIADELSQLRKSEAARKRLSQTVTDWRPLPTAGPDTEHLAKIQLPENPTKAQVKKYIRDIIGASRGQNTWSDRDPQIGMLTKVGPENLPVLLEFLNSSGSMNNYHLVRAIVHLSNEQSASLILDALPIHHELIKVVVRHGWEDQARKILLDEVKNTDEYLPSEWLVALANLNDPDTYPFLREYFVSGPNKRTTYKAIKHLPIDDMTEAVARAWKMSQYGGPYDRNAMAVVAIEYGHEDALAVLIDILLSARGPSSFASRETRPAILKHVEFRGSNEELVRWFEQNRKHIHFDKEAKKFVVRK